MLENVYAVHIYKTCYGVTSSPILSEEDRTMHFSSNYEHVREISCKIWRKRLKLSTFLNNHDLVAQTKILIWINLKVAKQSEIPVIPDTILAKSRTRLKILKIFHVCLSICGPATSVISLWSLIQMWLDTGS